MSMSKSTSKYMPLHRPLWYCHAGPRGGEYGTDGPPGQPTPCEVLLALHIPRMAFVVLPRGIGPSIKPEFVHCVSAVLFILDAYIRTGGSSLLLETLLSEAEMEAEAADEVRPGTIRFLIPASYDTVRDIANMMAEMLERGDSAEFKGKGIYSSCGRVPLNEPHPCHIKNKNDLLPAFCGDPSTETLGNNMIDLSVPMDPDANPDPVNFGNLIVAKPYPGSCEAQFPAQYTNTSGEFRPPQNNEIAMLSKQRWLSGVTFTRIFNHTSASFLSWVHPHVDPPAADLLQKIRFYMDINYVELINEMKETDDPMTYIINGCDPSDAAEYQIPDPTRDPSGYIEHDPCSVHAGELKTTQMICEAKMYPTTTNVKAFCQKSLRDCGADDAKLMRFFTSLDDISKNMYHTIQPGVVPVYAKLRRGMKDTQRAIDSRPRTKRIVEAMLAAGPVNPKDGSCEDTHLYFLFAQLWAITIKLSLIPQQASVFVIKYLLMLSSLDPAWKHIFLCVSGAPNIGKSKVDDWLQLIADSSTFTNYEYMSAKVIARQQDADCICTFFDELARHFVSVPKEGDNAAGLMWQ